MRLEGGLLPVADLVDLMVEQWSHPFVQVLLGAMVGVQGDGDVRVLRGHLVRERRERQRANAANASDPTTRSCTVLPEK